MYVKFLLFFYLVKLVEHCTYLGASDKIINIVLYYFIIYIKWKKKSQNQLHILIPIPF